MKNIRNVPGHKTTDPSSILNNQYSEASGSQKISEVGRHLLPLTFISGGVTAYTTDATTIKALSKKGACLAVYNNAGAVGSVTLGETSSQASLAPGVTDATGHVGVPCTPNSWTYIACGEQNFVIASAVTLLVFLIDDESSIKQEATR